MNVTRLKLWMFRIELAEDHVVTVNRRGDVWCLGPEGERTKHEAPTLHQVLSNGLCFKSSISEAIEQIVELLVKEELGVREELRKVRDG